MRSYQVAYAQLNIEPERKSLEFRVHHPFRPHAIGVWCDYQVNGVRNRPLVTNFQLAHTRELIGQMPAEELKVFPKNLEAREVIENMLAVPATQAVRYEHVRLKVQHYTVYLQPNMKLNFSTLSQGQTMRIDWTGCLSSVLILGASTHLAGDPLGIHGKTLVELAQPSVNTKHRDDLRRIPEEDIPMVDSYEEQLDQWVIGRSCHVRVANSYECCPDFSCCYPDCAHSFEVREKYIKGDGKERYAMCAEFLREFVGKVRANVRVIS